MKQREPKKTETLEVRLPPETKTAFMAACRANGVSASRVLRGFIARYLASASRAPIDRKRELAMFFTARTPRGRIAAGAFGLASAAFAALSLVAPARAAPDPRVAAVFDLLDGDHDGRISAAEFLAPLPVSSQPTDVELIVETRVPPAPGETAEALFARIDADGDGALTLAELDAAAVARTVPTPALAAADRDGDGAITEGELAAHLTAQRAAAGLPRPAAGIGLLARGIVAEHARDGEGRIFLADIRER